jgi:hypothetical protein
MTGFASDIRPLFRDKDIDGMLAWFDLADYETVRDNAAGILERVMDGSMPCDGPWPAERIAQLQQWIDEGCPA